MISALHESVNKLMDGFFQQQEENKRLNKRCDELQTELRELQKRLTADHAEFERRIESASKSFENLTLDHVLVGYMGNGAPVFANKDIDTTTFYQRVDKSMSFVLILDSLQYFKNVKFDFMYWYNNRIIDKCGNNICLPPQPGFYQTAEQAVQNTETKNMYKLCKQLGITFTIYGQDRLNGVPVKLLFEDLQS